MVDRASSCATCELSARRAAGEAPAWDDIARYPGWDLGHAFGTAVEGWLVLVAQRHITAVAELTDEEATELGRLIRVASRALGAVTGCAKTYVVQFAEHPDHQHVHVHVVPRSADLPPEHRGPRIFQLLGLPDEEAVPEDRMLAVAAAIRAHLAP